MIRRIRSFTLLEVCIATTLMAVAVAMATLHMPAVTVKEQVRTVGMELRSLWRLARFDSVRTGRPCALELTPDRCTVKRVLRTPQGWRWVSGPLLEMPNGVQVIDVSVQAGTRTRAAEWWRVPVSGQTPHMPCRVTLRTRDGATFEEFLWF